MKTFRVIFWVAFIAAGVACVVASYRQRWAGEREVLETAAAAREEALRIEEKLVLYRRGTVPARLPFNALLEGAGIDSVNAARMVASTERVFDLRRVRAGNSFAVGRSVAGDLREVRYRIDVNRELLIAPDGGGFHAEIQTIPSRTDTVGVSGEIHGSLFEAVIDAGEKPELAMRLAEIFGWDLDFYTDARPGDTFRLVVEKKQLSNGETAGYGRILAAEYNNERHPYRAVLFHEASGNPAYFTPEGKSMKKAFLHSPLKFSAPITSHFSTHRYHPILKQTRPHLGIDYGAPIGTPVQTIGDGRVIFAGPKGGAGNLVEVAHTNGYNTYYLHLSRILVRNGERVAQGQRIGLVGMTGLATGPHLDFRIERRGEFLNFERLPLPTADPVAKRDWQAFAGQRDRAMAWMPAPGPQPSLARNASLGAAGAAPTQPATSSASSSTPLVMK